MPPRVDDGAFFSPRTPDLAELLSSGIGAAQRGERHAARCLLNEVVETDPRCEDAWMWLASVSEYPEELFAFLKHVLEINPDNERAREWLASTRALLAKSAVQRAIAAHADGAVDRAGWCLDQALEHDEQCEMAWFWKASLAADHADKLAFLERVIEINPENQEASDALSKLNTEASARAFADAKTAAVAGKRKKALELVDEFLRTVPDNAEAWVLRSHLSLGLDEKVASLREALAIDPDNAAARASYDFLVTTLSGEVDESEQIEHDMVSHVADENYEPRSAEEMFGPTEETVDAEAATVENVSVPEELLAETFEGQPEPVFETAAPDSSCPFCAAANDAQAFACTSCNAVLTLSDLESLLANPHVDRETMQQAVAQMEAEWNFRDFSEQELINLGIGHFNLRSFEPGLKYLQEASRLSPNNVILSGQVNALAIRLEELRRKEETQTAAPEGKTILVVDDSPTVRKLISGKLEKAGHTVICAVDGVEALAVIEETMPDLVLLDIAMPRMDGYEVCKQIRSNPAAEHLPVVMISGKDGFFDKVRGRMAGTTGYVTKPFGPETLMKALETYLVPSL